MGTSARQLVVALVAAGAGCLTGLFTAPADGHIPALASTQASSSAIQTAILVVTPVETAAQVPSPPRASVGVTRPRSHLSESKRSSPQSTGVPRSTAAAQPVIAGAPIDPWQSRATTATQSVRSRTRHASKRLEFWVATPEIVDPWEKNVLAESFPRTR